MVKKERRKRYVRKGMNMHLINEKKKKGKKRTRKPKMPARIKSTPRSRHR
mgnify:CR=1 FL=1